MNLESKELELSRKKFSCIRNEDWGIANTKVNYDDLLYASKNTTIREECNRLRENLSAKKLLYRRLQRKCAEMEHVMTLEKEKRDVKIENSVRDEAAAVSDRLKGMVVMRVRVHAEAIRDSKEV